MLVNRTKGRKAKPPEIRKLELLGEIPPETLDEKYLRNHPDRPAHAARERIRLAKDKKAKKAKKAARVENISDQEMEALKRMTQDNEIPDPSS